MSTLKVTNIQDTAGGHSMSTEGIYNGVAKVWVNFNGTGTVAIRGDYNVNTISDNGTGDYTINFSTALTDANYCVEISMGETTGTSNTGYAGNRINGKQLAHLQSSSVRCAPYNNNGGGLVDVGTCCVACFR